MKHALYRRSSLVVAAVAGAAVLAPLGGVAHAVVVTPIQFYTAIKSGDAYPSLWNRATNTRVSTLGANVIEMRSSRDGSRFVTVEAWLNSAGNQQQSVVVYDVSGRRVAIPQSVPSDTSDLLFPALSPDGTKVVWNRGDHAAPGATLLVKDLLTGTVTNLGTMTQPTFLTPTTLLVRDADQKPYTLPITGGTPTPLASLPDWAIQVTVSPDGTRIAWEDEYYGTPETSEIAVAKLSTSGGITVGTPKLTAVGQHNFGPAFSRDGAKVYWVHTDGAGGAGTIYRLTATWDSNGNPTGVSNVGIDSTSLGNVRFQAFGEKATATSLPLPTTKPATLGGTAARVYWTNPVDSRVSQIQVKRYLGSSTTPQKTAYVPVPGTSYLDTGLTVGSTYTYTFASVDRSGNVGTSVSRKLTAAGAAPSAADPTSRTTTRAPFPVRFGNALSNVLWSVDYRVNSGATWTSWVTKRAGTVRTFGSAATPVVAATSSVTGQTYAFRSRAFDGFGNSTALVYSARTVVPRDQSGATLYGGTTVSDSRAWYGSYRRMAATSNYTRITLTGNRLQVVGWKCSGCGSFSVWDNGSYLGTFSTSASSTLARVVVLTKTYTSNATHTFTIKPYSAKPVLLDGFAMRR
jgi:hypothetical protein